MGILNKVLNRTRECDETPSVSYDYLYELTKSRLLEIASSRNLSVSSKDSKSAIIDKIISNYDNE